LVVSEIFVVISVYAIFITIFLSGALLFFGRGNKNSNNSSKSTVANEAPEEEVQSSSETDDSKITRLKDRAKADPPKRMIPKDQLDKGKKELRTLLVEKELVAAALTRLYQAEAAGEITKEERETLGARYREELKGLDKKIRGLDVFIEVGDLETLRDQLLRLVGEKIEAIEKRIERTQLQAQPLIQEILERNSPRPKTNRPSEAAPIEKSEKRPQVPDISDMLVTSSIASKGVEGKGTDGISTPAAELTPMSGLQTEMSITEPVSVDSNSSTPTERTPTTRKRNSTSSDGQVEELQKELLEALDRLEKLDIEA
jgi:hypothetical protein